MLEDFDLLVGGEAFPGCFEHRLRKVDTHPVSLGPRDAEEREEPSVARAEIKDPPDTFGDMLDQDGLAFGPVGELVGQGQVLKGVLGRGPFVDRQRVHLKFIDGGSWR